MERFVKHRGIAAVLDRANVDTDQIIPKQFLKSIQRTGFGENLFYDWRYSDDGTPDESFELNAPRYEGASVLVTRNNFGCGSSREHAVWAIVQYGFRAVIAPRIEREGGLIPGFADIFRGNCVKNGLLTVELTEREVDEIIARVHAHEGLEITVDLENQRVILHTDDEPVYLFDVEPSAREMLMSGSDPIAVTLQYEDDIRAFERRHNDQLGSRAGA